jgi:hypothetical protein
MLSRANFFTATRMNIRSKEAKMTIELNQRKLGASELVVPALGVGVMSWGESMQGYGKTHSREDKGDYTL